MVVVAIRISDGGRLKLDPREFGGVGRADLENNARHVVAQYSLPQGQRLLCSK